ncbi:uncharacterized protein LOC134805832 [Cydia splendana]|uniref:uncharacterized protein LOC134805832 n=1 Tax=Cydia splendana TaxID=1100963 RepID=UPI00300CB536
MAKEDLHRAKREEMRLRAEEEVAGIRVPISTRSQTGGLSSSVLPGAQDNLCAAALSQRVHKSLDGISHVAKNSGHLKGTFVKALKDATASIKETVDCLLERTSTEETRRLQAQNDALRAQLTELKSEMTQLRADFRDQFRRTSPVPSQPKENTQPASTSRKGAAKVSSMEENMMRTMTAQIGLMLDARLGALGLEGRLLPAQTMRPPLAHDRRAERATSLHSGPTGQDTCTELTTGTQPDSIAGTVAVASPASSGSKQGAKPKPRHKKTTLAANEAATARELPQETPTPAAAPLRENWKDALGKKAKKAVKKPTAAKTSKTHAPKSAHKRKLRPPRTAVTLTLKPEAVEAGAKYETVLAEAKKRINLEDLGISAVRFRTVATGARMLELPPDTKEAEIAADALAEKLREVLDPNVVHIQRPVKCADIRVTGLDDSAIAEEVVAAVAKLGNCAVEAVKSGVIARSHNGSGSLWLSCPVAAATKVVDAGRLKVGWISARVILLDAKPLRCYRCLETGHVGAKCDKGVDRSNLCYRCGEPGHKSRECVGVMPNVLCIYY